MNKKMLSVINIILLWLSIIGVGIIFDVQISQAQTRKILKPYIIKLFKVVPDYYTGYDHYLCVRFTKKYIIVFYGIYGDISSDGKYLYVDGTGGMIQYVFIIDPTTGEIIYRWQPSGSLLIDLENLTTIWGHGEPYDYPARIVENKYLVIIDGTGVKMDSTITNPQGICIVNFTNGELIKYYDLSAIHNDFIGKTFISKNGKFIIADLEYDVRLYYVDFSSLSINEVKIYNYDNISCVYVSNKGEVILGGVNFIHFDFKDYKKIVRVNGTVSSIIVDNDDEPKYIGIATKDGYYYVMTRNGTILSYYKDTSQPYYYSCERVEPKIVNGIVPFLVSSTKGLLYFIDYDQWVVLSYDKANPDDSSIVGIDPYRGYVIMGYYAFKVIWQDIQSGKPRVRFWGDLVYENILHLSSTPFTISPPSRDWHLYIFSGEILVKKIFGTGLSRSLVPASFKNGDFNTIRKYVDGKPISGWGIATELYDRRESPDLKVVSLLFESKVTTVYREGYTVVATWIDVPLHNHLSIYSEVSPIPLVQTKVSVAVNDPTKPPKDVLVAFGSLILGFELGTPSGVEVGTIGYTSTKIFSVIAKRRSEFLAKQIADAIEHLRWYWGRMTPQDKLELIMNIKRFDMRATRYLSIAGKLTKVGKVLGWVGVAITVWQVMDAIYSWWGEYVIWVVNHGIFFTLIDEYGNKYLVGDVYCSKETFNDAKLFIEQLPNLFPDYRICVKARIIASSNKELIEKISKGDYPKFDLVSIAKARIEYDYNVPIEKLRITGFKIITFTLVKASQGVLTYFKGGLGILPQISYTIHRIDVKGTLKKQTFTTPDELYSVMNYVIINGEKVTLTKTDKGLFARFGFPIGVNKLVIEFPVENAHVLFDLKAEVCLKKEFEEVGNYGYTVFFHYDYPYRIIVKRIEFVDIPYPLKYLERIEHIAMRKFVDDLTKYVVHNSTIDDPNSPTGKRYSYVIMNRKGILVIDPANGGIMQPCKKYHFNYYYTEPPDVAIQLFLNGTSRVSSLPQHIAVILKSSVSQTVKYELTINIYVKDKLVHSETFTKQVTVSANIPYYEYYNITYYIELARKYNESSFIEFIGKILEAEYNYKKSNDYDRVVYFVPLVIKMQYPSSLTVFVYDATTGQVITEAYVRVSNDTTTLEGYTDVNGFATFTGLTTGYYIVHVSKSGYYDYDVSIFVNGSTTLNVPLVPVGYENYTLPPENGTSEPPLTKEGVKYWWLSVQVVFDDGAPFHGALVKIVNLTDGTTIAELETNGTGFVHYLLPDGANIRVIVNATNPQNASEFVTFERDLVMNQHYYLVFRVPWKSKYFEPEVSIVRVRIWKHEGLGYYFGKVSHLVELILWSNVEQTVVVRLVLYNVTDQGNITIAMKDIELKLHKGVNINWTWFEVNATYGSYVRVYANITQYQYDTDPTNNEAWSNIVRLKPFFNARVMVFVEPVKQKVPWAILPEDEIKIAVLIEFNMNVTKLKLSMHAFMHHLEKRKFVVFTHKLDEMSSKVAGKVWRNFTITVPWTDKLQINITLLNEFDVYPFDNNATITIYIDPNVKLEQVIFEPWRPVYTEGELITITAKYKSNTLTGTGEVGIYDETLKEGIKSQFISKLQPEFEVTVTFKLPENPEVEIIPHILRIKEPLTKHIINVTFIGTDYYLEDNYKAYEVRVASKQTLYIGIGIILLILFIILFLAIIVKLLKTVTPVTRPRKYIKIRS